MDAMADTACITLRPDAQRSSTASDIRLIDGWAFVSGVAPIDLNDDNVINILDIVLMASVLNQPAGVSTLSQGADFTGPPPGLGLPPAPDGVINIIDLVLVAKNFGASGPTDGTPPGGGFPF